MKKNKIKTIGGFLVICFTAVIIFSSIQEMGAYGIGRRYTNATDVYAGTAFYPVNMIKALETTDSNANANADIESYETENAEHLRDRDIEDIEIEADTPSLDVSAHSAILIDTNSKNIIYEQNAYKRLPMASTTKIITAITAIESGVPLDTIVKITKQMTGAEGSSVYLYEGERFSLNDLLYALLLNSANDSAEAIAISIAGSIENFAAMMNEKVKELNLKDTNLTNPHGLDSDMHYTTAYDLAAITAYALENDKFLEIVSTQNLVIYPLNEDGSQNHEGARFLRNHNKLLRMYEGTIGVKTGFTKRSGRCLVSAAERDGSRLVAVTINAPDDWNDHMNMLDYGFRNYSTIEICKKFEYEFEIDIVNGEKEIRDENNKIISNEVEKLQCVNISDEYASLPDYVKADDIKYRVELPDFVYAPVKKNDVVGRIIFTYEDKIIAYSTIVSLEDVKARESKSVIRKIMSIFGK